jgi:BlaI family penicillinase repressor
MKRKINRPLGKLELEIMQIVWNLGEATVREVLNVINKRKDLAYTTIMTMMQNLEKKDYLEHVERCRRYFYMSRIKRELVEKRMLNDVLNNVFNGSPTRLINTLIDTGGLSKKEIDDIKDLLDSKE